MIFLPYGVTLIPCDDTVQCPKMPSFDEMASLEIHRFKAKFRGNLRVLRCLLAKNAYFHAKTKVSKCGYNHLNKVNGTSRTKSRADQSRVSDTEIQTGPQNGELIIQHSHKETRSILHFNDV